MKKKILAKKVGEPLKIMEVDVKYRSEVFESLEDMEATIEYVHFSNNRTFTMLIDEDGISKKLPFNFFLSTTSKSYPIQPIWGNAYFVRSPYVDVYNNEIFDYEVEDITEEDIERIEFILFDLYQAELEKEFEKNMR